MSIDYNEDRIKDILLHIQHNLTIPQGEALPSPIGWSLIYNDPNLTALYSPEEIKYTLVFLKDNNFISTSLYRVNTQNHHILNFHINGITLTGFKLIEAMSDPTTWEKTKEKAKSLGKTTIELLIGAGITLGTGYVQSKF